MLFAVDRLRVVVSPGERDRSRLVPRIPWFVRDRLSGFEWLDGSRIETDTAVALNRVVVISRSSRRSMCGFEGVFETVWFEVVVSWS